MRDVRKRSLVFFAFLALLWVGCSGSVRLLDTFKERQEAGDYKWIAQQEVACRPDDDGCNQLHLIKGDACFRLAKQAEQAGQASEALTHYQCAATQLETGIEQTEDWSAAGGRTQWYANWCEALRQWRDAERGDPADRVNSRLLAAAQTFAAAVDGHPAAAFYRNNARLAMLRPQLLDPDEHPTLCDELADIHSDLVEAGRQAEGTAYAANIRQLRREVETAQSAVPGCP